MLGAMGFKSRMAHVRRLEKRRPRRREDAKESREGRQKQKLLLRGCLRAFAPSRSPFLTPARKLTNPRSPLRNNAMDPQLDKLKFDANGLIPIIVQDVTNGQVLMMAYMNRAAIEKTLESGKVHTYSRSRGRLALKGESSRHFQHVKEVRTDCDGDVLLFKVEQDVAACHEGYRSCFFRQYDRGGGAAAEWKIVEKKAFDPDA